MELGETTNISFRLKMENGWDGRSSKEILLANRQRLGCPSRGNILQYAHQGRAFFGIIFSFIDNGNMFSREHNTFGFFVGCPFANTKGNSIFPATSDCNNYTVHSFLFVIMIILTCRKPRFKVNLCESSYMFIKKLFQEGHCILL